MYQKKIIPIVWCLCITIGLSLSVSNQAYAQTAAVGNFRANKTLPAFELYNLDSTKVKATDYFVKGKPLVVMYFSPTCNHCQTQAQEITSKMKLFKDLPFLFVSAYPIADIKQFVADYGVSVFKNIHVAFDGTFDMGTFFELKEIPGIFIYNSKKELIGHFERNTTSEKIAAVITNQ